jgi:hypothetical protein
MSELAPCKVIEHEHTWLFVCANRHTQAAVITYCRGARGRSHGDSSLWMVSYWADPDNGFKRLPAVIIREQRLAFELMITFT